MMRLQLDAIHERGEPLAILWASEGNIYQRFGYGLGSLRMGINLARERARSGCRTRPRARSGSSRSTRPAACCRRSTRPFDRSGPDTSTARRRSGTPSSSPTPSTGAAGRAPPSTSCTRWRRPTATPATASRTTGTTRAEVGRRAGRADGHEPRRAARPVAVPPDIDLMARIEAWNLAVDDPILLNVAEPPAARGPSATPWTRIVDVPSALAGRRYAPPTGGSPSRWPTSSASGTTACGSSRSSRACPSCSR